MRAATLCLCIGLGSVLVGIRVVLTHTPEAHSCTEQCAGERRQEGSHRVRDTGCADIYEMTTPGMQAWLPIGAGAGLLVLGALLSVLRPRRALRQVPARVP